MNFKRKCSSPLDSWANGQNHAYCSLEKPGILWKPGVKVNNEAKFMYLKKKIDTAFANAHAIIIVNNLRHCLRCR